MNADQHGPKRLLCREMVGRTARVKRTITTRGGDVIAAGTIVRIHSIHRGRFAIGSMAGREVFVRQVARWDLEVLPEAEKRSP